MGDSRTVGGPYALVLCCALVLCSCGGALSASAPSEHPTAFEPRATQRHRSSGSRAAHTVTPDASDRAEVSLDGLLAYADAHSPVLVAARSTRARARAERTAAEPVVPDEPELAVSGGPRLSSGGAGVELEAGVSQRFEVAGERGRRIAAARRLREVIDAQVAEARWIVHCQIHAGFHEALVARERVTLAQSVLTFQEGLVHVVERRIAAGDAASFALRLAQAEVAQARQSVLAAQQQYLSVRLDLAEVSGWRSAEPPSPVGHLDEPRDPPALDTLLRVARRRFPALRARRAAVRASAARVSVADREASVRPSIGLTYRVERDPGDAGTGTHVVLGSMGLPLPLFRRNRGERARARAELEVARAELYAEERSLAARITRARAQVVAAVARLRSYGSDILPRFAENIGLLARAYELGEIDLLELSIGRERFLRIQSDALDAHRDYLVSLAALERVVGIDLWHDDHGEHAGGHR